MVDKKKAPTEQPIRSNENQYEDTIFECNPQIISDIIDEMPLMDALRQRKERQK